MKILNRDMVKPENKDLLELYNKDKEAGAKEVTKILVSDWEFDPLEAGAPSSNGLEHTKGYVHVGSLYEAQAEKLQKD